MPLSFDTLNHGPVAFGFFNIESDMLLLERRFFFAHDFCRWVLDVAGRDPEARFETVWPVLTIDRPDHVGDLMGAIHGVRFTGFIGNTYRRHPFPRRPEDFRQNPEGAATRAEFLELIAPYAREEEIPFAGDPETSEVSMGSHLFSREGFSELVRYVWIGGFPRWKDEVRPGYVLELGDGIEASPHWLFRGLALDRT